MLFSFGDTCPRLQRQVVPEQIKSTFQLFSLSISLNTEDLNHGCPGRHTFTKETCYHKVTPGLFPV